MNASTAHPTAVALVDDFVAAPHDERDARFRALVDALWSDGRAADAALPAVPALVGALADSGEERQGHLAILLGLLAESEYPELDGPLATAVGSHLDLYLRLVRAPGAGRPLVLALVYLLAHFPHRRDDVLGAVSGLGLEPEDLSRLDRGVSLLDPDDPDLGRVWPSPSAWTLNEDERAFDRSWITALSPQQIVANWDNDTRTVYGCAGARAYWAVCNGDPVNLPAAGVPEDRGGRAAPTTAGLFTPHEDALRCPACTGRLDTGGSGGSGDAGGSGGSGGAGGAEGKGSAGVGGDSGADSARCDGCGARYPVAAGILDLTAPVVGTGNDGTGTDVGADFLEKLSRVPSMGLFYEAVARPAFLRVSGSNWGGAVTPDDEDRYIAEHVRPVDGPVLDLGAGAGRWTAVIAETVGADRLIALDSALPMLNVLRGRLPGVPSVLAGAAGLPFADASLGAVVCWNALQAFYHDAAAAIAEVARCLRPGGTFTLMTFRRSDDPVYGYFQSAHRFPQHQGGLQLFDADELRKWLADAGLTVVEDSGPGTFVFLNAVRAA
ncbi:class I SAM-dependent methyltransferase [Streptomyces sp. PTD5-9]|uniref:class I SAM-dependent methyltransferase n=1 Tax=Streptomyces sp. PTD5-9 TaxID=3120150 RepID=UPI00300B19DC